MEISRIYFHDFSEIESEFLVFSHCAEPFLVCLTQCGDLRIFMPFYRFYVYVELT